jgi:hypothetical protein
MNTWVKVARYNLVRPANYLVLPWILAFSFAVGAVTAGRGRGHDAAGYLVSFFVYFAVLGMRTIGRSLPFGLTELDERVGSALTARTLRQLARLIVDLIGPRAAAASPGPHPAPATPGDRWAVLRSLLESA